MKQRILIVAHDPSLRATLARWLMAAGYAVELAEGPKRAREVFTSEDVALAIVAPDRLGAAGLDLARELGRRGGRLIMVAEGPGDVGRLAGSALVSGGCITIAKPLDADDVLARVASALEPPPDGTKSAAPESLRFDGWTLDVAGRVLLDAGGGELPLTRSEFALLLALAQKHGRVLSRDELRRAVAGRGSDGCDRGVDVLVLRLRRKIEPNPKEPRIILTVPGEGYKFTPKPIASETAAAPSCAGTAAGEPAAAPTAAVAHPGGARNVGLRRPAMVIAVALSCMAVATLSWWVSPSMRRDVAARSPAAQASELIWQAGQVWDNRRRTRATLVEVRDLLERAVALDKSNVDANARLGEILTTGILNSWSIDRSTDLLAADGALKRALEIDPTHSGALMSRCEWLRAEHRFEDALAVCQDVLARSQSSVRALKEIGYDKIHLGRAEEAVSSFAAADRLEPSSAQRWTWLQGGGYANLLLGRNDEALAWLRRATDAPQGSGRAFAWLAAAYALSGRDEEARAALREFRRLWPAATVTGGYFRPHGSPRAIEQMQHVLDGLRMAGLPE
jgi:two-component system OmpR family response regulator